MTRAVILLSGGLDSCTCLALAASQGRECLALSFRYGQRHEDELACAARHAAKHAARHEVIDLAHLGRLVAPVSSMVATGPAVPLAGTPEPSTYVPARNTLFLSYALALAEVAGAGEIWIGVNALDYSGYPDCRPEFVEAFARVALLAGRSPVVVVTPLLHLDKAQIATLAHQLQVDAADTLSCYDPREGLACGRCDSCALRRSGFERAQLSDPTRYKEQA